MHPTPHLEEDRLREPSVGRLAAPPSLPSRDYGWGRRTSRNDGLDLIRATGAALVFGTHLWHGFGMTWLGPFAEGGHLGVYLFFPLSGYLLYRPFVTGRVDLRRYAIARAARLLPAYYLALAGFAVLGLIPGLVANPFPALTLTANTFALGALDRGEFGQSWTLGVELLFYASLPFLALIRRGWILIALVIVSWWIGTRVMVDEWWLRQLPGQFWAFGFGMLTARYLDRLRSLARLWPLGAAVIGVGIVGHGYWLWGDDIVAVGTCWLIVSAVVIRPRLPFARWPADLSYGVYLWHVGVLVTLAHLGLVGLPLLVSGVFTTIAVAWLSFRYLERPILRLARESSTHDERDPAQSGAEVLNPERHERAVQVAT